MLDGSTLIDLEVIEFIGMKNRKISVAQPWELPHAAQHERDKGRRLIQRVRVNRRLNELVEFLPRTADRPQFVAALVEFILAHRLQRTDWEVC